MNFKPGDFKYRNLGSVVTNPFPCPHIGSHSSLDLDWLCSCGDFVFRLSCVLVNEHRMLSLGGFLFRPFENIERTLNNIETRV